jgi:hypothetical protein
VRSLTEERFKRGAIEVTSAEHQQQGLKDMVEVLKKNGCKFEKMVEVGSWKGGSVLEFSPYFKQVWCVDHWIGDKWCPNVYEVFLHNIRNDKNIIPIRKYSGEAAKLFDDESLDFVYIDADHREEFVQQDILLWLPKVKKSGAIAGHDYGRGNEGHFDFSGLTRAVERCVGKPHYVFKDTSWLVFKK